MTMQLESMLEIGVRCDLSSVDFDALHGLSLEDVRRRSVRLDGLLAELGECFRVSGSTDSRRCVMTGDCRTVDGIGTRLRHGQIRMEGAAGNRLGQDMRGGLIQVAGDAGNLVGGPSRGMRCGMRGGAIVIHGNAGDYLGFRLRRGTILALGEAQFGVGAEMVAGTIAIGRVGARGRVGASGLGVGMRRGTIVCLQRDAAMDKYLRSGKSTAKFSSPTPAPTVFRRLLADRLRQLADDSNILRAIADMTRVWQRAMGDRAVQGLGEIWFEDEEA